MTRDDLDEALYNATGSGRASALEIGATRTPAPAEVERFRCSLVTFLELLPSDLAAHELLDLLDHARAQSDG